MPSATFDGPNLIIQLPLTGTYDIETDIYSEWKEWAVTADNLKYPLAFETTGGDDIGGGQNIAPYFFCRNDLGWRIRAPEENGEVVLQGNLFPREAAEVLFIEAGGFDAFIRQEVSTRAVVLETGTSGLTAAEAAILTKLDALLINNGAVDANIKYVNGGAIQGTGEDHDPWGPS